MSLWGGVSITFERYHFKKMNNLISENKKFRINDLELFDCKTRIESVSFKFYLFVGTV